MQPENLHTPKSIRTFSGKYVNIFEPDPDTLCIEDIAHSLSMQCRFGGHLPMFFSVAQHSVMCCNHFIDFRPELRLTALMHDASEAYLLDLPRPIKLEIPKYKQIENALMQLIAKKFGFKWPMDEAVKRIDNFQLEKEWNELMLCEPNTDPRSLRCMSQRESKNIFLKAFNHINEFYPQNI